VALRPEKWLYRGERDADSRRLAMKDDIDGKWTKFSTVGISSVAENTPKHQKAADLLRNQRL
jgi:hypothetical protein